jgi:SAM-dependent methyltransferase
MRAPDQEHATWRGHIAAAAQLLARHLGSGDRVEILEAGCGSASQLQFPHEARRVGIDNSRAQLARHPALDERIVGDLQAYPYPAERFDAIVCWDVLEHLHSPEAALDGFARALRSGGLLVIGVPDRASLKGQLTRVLPYRAHVWVYRYVFRMRDAGTADRGPFPTPMTPAMDRREIVKRMHAHGFEILVDIRYESEMMIELRHRFGLTGRTWAATKRVARWLTANRLAIETSDCLIVLVKRGRDRGRSERDAHGTSARA